MTILITGGTGFIGSQLARALLAAGQRVRLMGRDFSRVGDVLAAGAEAVQADLRDPVQVFAACAGAAVVYHVGALSAPWGRWRDFRAINVGGDTSRDRRLHSASGGPPDPRLLAQCGL